MKISVRSYAARIVSVVMALALLLCVMSGGVSATGLTVVSSSDSSKPTAAVPEPKVPVGSAIIVDANTGAVLYEKDAYIKRPMASTTKMMTALLAVESGDLGREVTITAEMLAYDEAGSTKLGLMLGDKITMHDLVVGMMLLSGNDCAQAVAVELAGSYDAFASMMNERASRIGMLDTHFITPSGLDDPEHYSTAYDMALLGIEVSKNDDLMSICRLRTSSVYYGNPMVEHFVATHNYLMEGQSHGVKGCDGIKTGYTNDAGFCLVSHARREGVDLVCTTLGVPSYWSYQGDIYEYAFSQYETVSAAHDLTDRDLMVIGGSQQSVKVKCDTSELFAVPRWQINEITPSVYIIPYEYAPISQGQRVGALSYYYGTLKVAEYPIVAAENIDCVTNDWLSAYIDAIKYNISG